MSSQLDFSKWGYITVHEGEYLVIQFHPKSRYALYEMHSALLDWGKENNREIGLLLNSAKNWPVPCSIVFPVENLQKEKLVEDIE